MADHDPVVRSRVQSLVRTAFGAPESKSSSTPQSALFLSTDTVRGISLGVAVMTAAGKTGQVDTAESDRYWHHAIAVALTAREIARRVGVRDRDKAFVVGFLHDLGLSFGLLQSVPITKESTAPPGGLTSADNQTSPRDTLNHPEVGATLAEDWRLTPQIVQAIRDHHRDDLSHVAGQDVLLTRTLQVADWLAASQGISVPGDPAASNGPPEARSDLRLDDDALEQLCLGLGYRVSQVCAALGLNPVSADLAARTLFRLQLEKEEPPIVQDSEPVAVSASSLTENLIPAVSEALLDATEDEDSLSAFCEAAAQRTGVERVRCALSSGQGGTLVASCEPGCEEGPTLTLRRMSDEAWQAVQDDQVTLSNVGHTFLKLDGGRRLDILVRVSQAADLEPAVTDIGIAARLLGLALRNVAPPPTPEPAAPVVPACESEPSPPSPTLSHGDDALRILGEMAGGAAHDVNNTLAVVLGQAQLGQVAESVQEAQQYFSAIERASRDCAGIVRRLQEFARNARKPCGVGNVDLATLAKETLDLTRPRWKDEAQRRGSLVRTALELSTPVPVRADAGALRQVVTNLILNAIDAMPAGGTLTLKAWSEGDRALLSVADTGVGMSEDVLTHIFEPFFTTKSESGTGLGLAVSKRLVHENGGEIRVTSRPGLGSVFTISLPYAEACEDSSPEEACPPVRTALRVLLIDDEPQVRDVLIRMLHLDGHQAMAASTGTEGLKLLEQESFDLVMTDLGLPDMPGWQLARAAKSSGRTVPVILVTGWSEDGSGPAPVDGVDAVLAKPFGMVELRRVVKAAMEKTEKPQRPA